MGKKTAIVLAVIAAVLLAFILVFEQHTLSSGELQERQGRLLQSFVRPRVSRLEVQRHGTKMVLERDRPVGDDEVGHWKMSAPVRTKVDEDAVDALLGELEWAEARRTLEDITPADRRRFRLDRPRVRAWYTVAGTRVPIAIGGEDPRGEGVYVQLDDPTRVFVVGKNVFEALDHDAAHFRSKRLFAEGGLSRGRAISLRGPEGEWRATKRDQRWWIDAPTSGLASQSKIEDVLRAAGDLDAARFVEESPRDLARYGLARPLRDVQIEIEPERARSGHDAGAAPARATTARLRVGAPCQGHPGERYAIAGASGPVVCVAESGLTELGTGVDELREKRLVVARSEDVSRFAIAQGARRVELRRDGDAWKWSATIDGRRSEGDADGAAVEDWLRNIGEVRAGQFLPADDATLRAHGLAQPRMVLTIEGEDRPREEVRIGTVAPSVAQQPSAPAAETPSGAFARRGDEAAVLEVSARAIAALVRASPVLFRNRRVTDDDEDAVQALTIRRGATTEELTKQDDAWRIRAPIAAPADASRTRALARQIARIEAVRFVSDQPEPAHGLAAPRMIVTARLASGTRTLRIGARADGGAYAQLDGQAGVFIVPPALSDDISTPLVDPDVMSTDAEQVAALAIQRGAQRVEIRRQGDAFRTPTGASASAAIVERVATLHAIATSGYGPPSPAQGLAAPRARISITRTEGAPEPHTYDVLIGAKEGEGSDARVHVRRSDLAVGLLIAADEAQAFLDYQP